MLHISPRVLNPAHFWSRSGQDAQRSVFREWEKDAPDSVDGLDEATWLASLHRQESQIPSQS